MVLDVEKLIRLVQERRSLWCHAAPSYKNNKCKQLLWDDIGRKLNVSGLTVKNKWRNLRDTFSKQLVALNQPSGKKFVRWQYYNPMSFIKTELQFRSRLPNQQLTEGRETIDVTYLDNETLLAPPPVFTEEPTQVEQDILTKAEMSTRQHDGTSTDTGGMQAKQELGKTKTELGRAQRKRSEVDSKKSSNYYFMNSLVDPLDSLPLEVQLHIKEQYTYLMHSAVRVHNNIPSVPGNVE